MTEPTRRIFTLALALTPGVGGKTITRILTRNDLFGRTISDFLKYGVEVLREEYRMSAKSAEIWATEKQSKLKEAEEMQMKLDPFGIKLVTLADATYPQQIELMDTDPPGMFYFYGNQRLLDSASFAVLCSRKSGEEELRSIEKLAEEGVLAGKTLISGHDTPEYQRSAIVPLRWGAPRILVLDQGLFKALGNDLKEEPFRAARLWRYQFDPRTDLAISPINPFGDYHPNSNRVRDRLVAGLAGSIDVVNANPNGNMHKLAISALRAGRQVRVVQGSATADHLASLGAKVIEFDAE